MRFSIEMFFFKFRVLFTRSINIIFGNIFFKIGSYDTIDIFKNYFIIIFLIISNI